MRSSLAFRRQIAHAAKANGLRNRCHPCHGFLKANLSTLMRQVCYYPYEERGLRRGSRAAS
jgi:hypothetical protein